MRRRSAMREIGMAAGIGGCVLLAVGLLLRQEPATVRVIPTPPPEKCSELSGEFTRRVHHLVDAVTNGEESWSEVFTADQINAYLQEEFLRVRPFRISAELHSFRVAIEPDRLRLAFRYGHGFWSTVISMDLRVWLVAQEVNLLAVEVLDLRAGVFPLTLQSILERVADNASSWNLEVNWYRHENRPVALVRWQPDQPHPSVILEQLELRERKLRISGRSSEPWGSTRALSFQRPSANRSGE